MRLCSEETAGTIEERVTMLKRFTEAIIVQRHIQQTKQRNSRTTQRKACRYNETRVVHQRNY